MRAVFFCNRLRKTHDAPLGGAQRAAHRHAFPAGGPRDADDPAALLLDHLFQYRAAAQKHELQVIENHVVEFSFADVGDRHQRTAEASAVDQHVDFSKAFHGFVNQRVDLPVVAAIGGDGDSFAAFLIDRLDDAVKLRLHFFQINQNKRGAFARESVGNRLAYTARAADYNCNLTV